MSSKPGVREALWMAAGAGLLLVAIVAVTLIRDARTPLELLAAKSRRADAVSRMLTGLASAEDAEKSAMLEASDDDAMRHADDARAAMEEAERAHAELARLVTGDSPPAEHEALAKVSASFAEVRRIDAALLELVAKNTNVKATALANGPAADSLREMSAALDKIVAAGSASAAGPRAALFAGGAQAAALRLQAVLPRHIAESSEREMDEFEAVMKVEDEKVRRALLDLGNVAKGAESADAAAAWAAYQKFSDFRAKVVALSRENTNVRALATSRGEKRKALGECRAALGALRKAIDEEPVPGLAHEPPAKSR